MPELPEVATVVRELQDHLAGKVITDLRCLRPGTVIDKRTQKLKLQNTIVEIKRRGKYIIIELSNNIALLIHLRMTGKLSYQPQSQKKPEHCRAEIVFDDGSEMFFDDVRTFGKIMILETSQIDKELQKLGVEPLSSAFNEKYLAEKVKTRQAPIKNLLLDQHLIAGLGNIYACEILHRAGVSPLRSGKSLHKREITRIVNETKQVLREALDKNGTTISDYRRVDDKQGEFQNFLRVYGKKKCECGEEISRIKQAGRTSYYCPECQK